MRVLKSSCKVMEGIQGNIIDETKNTIVVEDKDERVITLPKKACVFEFEIREGHWVKIQGNSVCYAPEDRLKKIFKKLVI